MGLEMSILIGLALAFAVTPKLGQEPPQKIDMAPSAREVLKGRLVTIIAKDSGFPIDKPGSVLKLVGMQKNDILAEITCGRSFICNGRHYKRLILPQPWDAHLCAPAHLTYQVSIVAGDP